MCDTAGELPGLGASKTITQIAMEQCEDMQQFRCGNKVKTLWSKTSRQECEGSLAAMRTVVEDVLARLNVDFHVNDLYMMFHCMNLDEWHEALTLAASQGSPSNSRLFALHRAARRLCDGLRVQEASEAAWLEVITAVLKHRTAIRQQMPPHERRTPLDHRVVWACALHGQAAPSSSGSRPYGSWTWVAPVIQFYISVMDGTGAVERGLGQHAAVLARHVGAPEGDVSMSDVCLEISCEGPAKHEDMFTPGTGETLLLNEFSRTCAQLWLVHHGRRFACTKQRRGHGRTDTQWRLKGSMQAVRHRQKLATDLLLQAAARDDQDENAKTSRNTIVGVTRSQLMRGAGQHKGPFATKTLLNFRNATRTRMKARDQVQMWVGMPKVAPRKRTCHAMSPLVSAAKKWIRKTPTNHPSLGVPKVRGSGRKGLAQAARAAAKAASLRGGCAVKAGIATSSRAASQGSSADTQSATTTTAVRALSGAAPSSVMVVDDHGKYSRIDVKHLDKATVIVVASHNDLLTRDASHELLSAWLWIIATGRQVQTKADLSANKPGKQYAKSAQMTAVQICFSPSFLEKHRSLVKQFRALAQHKASKWTEMQTGGKDVVCIHQAEDFRQFLIRQGAFQPFRGSVVTGART